MPSDVGKPALRRIIESDYGALVGLILPLVGWALYLLVTVLGTVPDVSGRGRPPFTPGTLPGMLPVAILLTLGGLALLAWRVRHFQDLFARGVQVTGYVNAVWFVRDRGRVEYSYRYMGRDYRSANTLHKSARAAQLTCGIDVDLVVDRDRPERAAIRQLYV